MAKQLELSLLEKYLKIYGARYKLAQELWIKEMIVQLMKRRSEILATF